ncbi:sugar phosphate isomerase/epimerase [Schnuerera sp. xch1]|uniref:sugar phosphate isomerase/epimerase family protein n=1 Tax=Schnuerera sp. xch1 TaxID=2874283 RepID=UPI001CBAD9A8|nr:sugar phosphate isomerase/epimerase [Schnuerera sp. xch1]MBZ2175531.1 sugar phosphate isomerase/epimerase [Schnuerera sp. xch1]
MKREFSLAHLTVLGCAPPEMTYIAAMSGYDYVSIRPIYMGLSGEPNYDLASNKEMLKQTKRALSSTNMKVHDIELARIYNGVDVKEYLPAFEVAAELGAKSVLSSIWTPNRDFYIEKFAELCDLAKSYRLTVDLEFVTWADVDNLEKAVDILNTVNRDNAGIMIDTLHFHRSRVSLEELDSIPREWFHFAHICDGPSDIPTTKEELIHTGRDERLYVGEGSIDIAAILKRIPEVVYSIELPHIKRVKEYGYAEHARRCLQTAKDYLNTNSHI